MRVFFAFLKCDTMVKLSESREFRSLEVGFKWAYRLKRIIFYGESFVFGTCAKKSECLVDKSFELYRILLAK